MQRGSDKHSARMDDALEAEVSGLMRAGHDSRADWNSPEPSGEDQPDVDRVPNATLHGGVPEGMTESDVEARSEMASYLGRVWPASREELLLVAVERHAPDAVLRDLERLSPDQEFTNLQDVWRTLHGTTEDHRF